MEKISMNKSSKEKNLLNKCSKGKISWTNLQRTNLHEQIFKREKSPKQIFKRKNLLNKSSKDKSPRTHLHEKGKNLLNKSSNDKSPWTHLHENEKSPDPIFKGQISINKFQKINDEKFSKDFIKINGFSFWRGNSILKKKQNKTRKKKKNHTSQNDGTIKH